MSRTFIAQVINVSKSTILSDISRNLNAKGVKSNGLQNNSQAALD